VKIFFVTGNENKFNEVRSMLGEMDIERSSVDVDEIQDVEIEPIVKAKAKRACELLKSAVLVEDTGVFINGLNGLPGGLIKWFLKRLGNEGIYNLVGGRDTSAKAVTVAAYCEPGDEPVLFRGELDGEIVLPHGPDDFGWDPIFRPKGHDSTLASLPKEEREGIKMRRIAFNKFREWFRQNRT